jgi:quercetin dioxygenase-like cupin family protein
MSTLPFRLSSGNLVFLVTLIILVIIWVYNNSYFSNDKLIKNYPFNEHVPSITTENTNYRQVANTADGMQLVLMSLLPGEQTGLKIYKNTQFIRCEQGDGLIMVDGKYYNLKEGDTTIVAADKIHNIKNTSNFQRLQLSIVYSGQEFQPNTNQKSKPHNE